MYKARKKRVAALALSMVFSIVGAGIGLAAEPTPFKSAKFDKYDFDGNGKKDLLVVNFCGKILADRASQAVIDINGVTLKLQSSAGCIFTKVRIFDIDPRDGKMEFAITEDIASEDYVTHFYGFNGKKIVDMGVVEGHMDNSIKVPGDATVVSEIRSSLMHTWWMQASYRVNSSTKRLALQNESVFAAQSDCLVTVAKPFKAYTAMRDSASTFTLSKGTRITLNASDEKQWVRFGYGDKKTGWIRMENKQGGWSSTIKGYGHSGDYLNGLRFAD